MGTETRIKDVSLTTQTRHMIGESPPIGQVIVSGLPNQLGTIGVVEDHVSCLEPTFVSVGLVSSSDGSKQVIVGGEKEFTPVLSIRLQAGSEN